MAEQDELICCFDRLAFAIIDEVPVMIEARARRLHIDEINELKK